MAKKWLSSYDKCDICNGVIKGAVEYFIDGKVRGNSGWALMCPSCFKKHGIKIGPGFGQKYHGTTAELLEGGLE
jgi:hypothetical protein